MRTKKVFWVILILIIILELVILVKLAIENSELKLENSNLSLETINLNLQDIASDINYHNLEFEFEKIDSKYKSDKLENEYLQQYFKLFFGDSIEILEQESLGNSLYLDSILISNNEFSLIHNEDYSFVKSDLPLAIAASDLEDSYRKVLGTDYIDVSLNAYNSEMSTELNMSINLNDLVNEGLSIYGDVDIYIPFEEQSQEKIELLLSEFFEKYYISGMCLEVCFLEEYADTMSIREKCVNDFGDISYSYISPHTSKSERFTKYMAQEQIDLKVERLFKD